jgi:hypothetical protein
LKTAAAGGYRIRPYGMLAASLSFILKSFEGAGNFFKSSLQKPPSFFKKFSQIFAFFKSSLQILPFSIKIINPTKGDQYEDRL